MNVDIRAEAAKFYDRNPTIPNDIPFYRDLIPSPGASILELGCGTGRVTLALVPHCSYIQGIDRSASMISICREKLLRAGIPPGRGRIGAGDISDFDVGRRFDLIIAPFRVLQNLETDAEVDGLFACIRRHIAPTGTCILNVFRPYLDPEALRTKWSTSAEEPDWEAPLESGRLVCSHRTGRVDAQRLILYPELIYRRYEHETLVEESHLSIPMRCYYPDTFERLILGHGFTVLGRWGGYAGEVYGQGPELVIQFGLAT